MNKCPDFEKNYYSTIARGIYKLGHHSIRFMKWLAYYDISFYVNKNYYHFLGSNFKNLNEISKG